MANTIMITSRIIAPSEQVLPTETVLTALHQGLDGHFRAQKVLILIPIIPAPCRFLSSFVRWLIFCMMHASSTLWLLLARIRRLARKTYCNWLGLLPPNGQPRISMLACLTMPGTILERWPAWNHSAGPGPGSGRRTLASLVGRGYRSSHQQGCFGI